MSIKKQESTFIAKGDLLWTRGGVPWTPTNASIPIEKTVAGLIHSPSKFIRAYDITVPQLDENGDVIVLPNGDIAQEPALVRSPHTITYQGVNRTIDEQVAVQGIHKTSRLTVMTEELRALRTLKSAKSKELRARAGMGSFPREIPEKCLIQITLVPRDPAKPICSRTNNGAIITMCGKAYIHWEISETAPTPSDELADHILTTLLSPQTILDCYNKRLTFGSGINGADNADLRFVDKQGKVLTSNPTPLDVVVEYTDCRGISSETDEFQSFMISCNADIGNYYIDANGQIHLVIDNTIVKMY